MKIALIAILIFFLLIPVSLFVLGYKSKYGSAPGLIDSKLAPCPETPNCVCSEFDKDPHYIEPVALRGLEVNTAKATLKDIVLKMGGELAGESDDYIAARFSSKIFGFVDDLEVRIDAVAGIAHIRSAARVGQSDLGVNRKRVEKLKQRFAQR